MVGAGIAKLWKPVVNVTNLDEGERFWSAVLGYVPTGRHGRAGRVEYACLDAVDDESAPWLLLQLVESESAGGHGGTHLDLRVDDVAEAVRQIEELGGTVLKPPALYPPDTEPYLEWAIMEDPFGNDFCVIRYPLR